MAAPKNTICLWYDGQAQEAAEDLGHKAGDKITAKVKEKAGNDSTDTPTTTPRRFRRVSTRARLSYAIRPSFGRTQY